MFGLFRVLYHARTLGILPNVPRAAQHSRETAPSTAARAPARARSSCTIRNALLRIAWAAQQFDARGIRKKIAFEKQKLMKGHAGAP